MPSFLTHPCLFFFNIYLFFSLLFPFLPPISVTSSAIFDSFGIHCFKRVLSPFPYLSIPTAPAQNLWTIKDWVDPGNAPAKQAAVKQRQRKLLRRPLYHLLCIG